MSGGDIAGLIAAGVFALLVLLLAVPILKLGRVLDEVRTSIRSISDGATPLMDEVTATVSTTNQQLKKWTALPPTFPMPPRTFPRCPPWLPLRSGHR